MPDPTTLLTYVAVLAGFVFFPGPSIIMTLARTTTSGPRIGIATSLGIAVGDLGHTLLAVIGLSAIIMTSAQAFTVVKLLGAAYLIYIGLRSLLERGHADGRATGAGVSVRAAFRQACVAELLNPKSAMFFLAFLPQFVTPANGSVPSQLLVLGAIFVLMGTFATMTVALGAGRVNRFLRRNPAIEKWQSKVVGSIYCGLGIRLVFQEK